MAVAAEDDQGVFPALTQAGDHSLENRQDGFSRQSLAGFENSGNQISAYALEDMKRHIAILIVVTIEKRQLLMSMDRVVRIIVIEDDDFRLFRVGIDEIIHDSQRDAVKFRP